MGKAKMPVVFLAVLLSGCAAKESGQSQCTAQALKKIGGAGIITVTLLIPDRPMQGAEIVNRGIIVMSPKCDFALNAFMSAETAQYLTDGAKGFPLVLYPSMSKVADAELSVWSFKDGSGEPRFFVDQVLKLSPPTKIPEFTDPKFFRRVGSGS